MPDGELTGKIALMNTPAIGPQLDIAAPTYGVEVSTNAEGSILWVNVEGICRLRVCRIPKGRLTGVKITEIKDET